MANVDAVAHDGMARFTQVDADLVGAAGLEAASDERRAHPLRVSGQRSARLDMRDGFARVGRGLAAPRRAAQAVAAILDEKRAKRARRHHAVRDREVLALYRMPPELPPE